MYPSSLMMISDHFFIYVFSFCFRVRFIGSVTSIGWSVDSFVGWSVCLSKFPKRTENFHFHAIGELVFWFSILWWFLYFLFYFSFILVRVLFVVWFSVCTAEAFEKFKVGIVLGFCSIFLFLFLYASKRNLHCIISLSFHFQLQYTLA